MSPQDYSGTGNLEVLVDAHRYNNFLVNQVLKAADGATTALDFGAGTGTFAVLVRDAGLAVTCVEPDAGLRGRLEERGLEAIGNLDGVPPASLPFLYSLNVLEHIEDDRAVLGQLHARLRPGARFYLYVPAFQVLFSSMDRRVGHFRRYRKKPLCGLASAVGFEVESARYVDSLGFLASLVYRLVGSRDGTLSPGSVQFYDRVVFPASRLFDRLGCDRLFGKNLALVLRRPGPD